MLGVDLRGAARLAGRLIAVGRRLDQLGARAREIGLGLGHRGRVVGVLQPGDHLAPADLGAPVHREGGDASGDLGGHGRADPCDDVTVGGNCGRATGSDPAPPVETGAATTV